MEASVDFCDLALQDSVDVVGAFSELECSHALATEICTSSSNRQEWILTSDAHGDALNMPPSKLNDDWFIDSYVRYDLRP